INSLTFCNYPISCSEIFSPLALNINCACHNPLSSSWSFEYGDLFWRFSGPLRFEHQRLWSAKSERDQNRQQNYKSSCNWNWNGYRRGEYPQPMVRKSLLRSQLVKSKTGIRGQLIRRGLER